MLEAVTVCVNYADFLREAIPFNAHHFDRWVIVTSPADTTTRHLCHHYNLPCIVTDEFYRDGAKFNKGRGVQRGLDALRLDGQVLHLDADIVLPGSFRHALMVADLDPQTIYGADRVMVPDWKAWQNLKASGWLQSNAWEYHHRLAFPPGLPLGARWVSLLHGYVPIGFFQLWHGDVQRYHGIHARPYPGHHSEASRADVQHGLQWDRRRRAILPEVVVAHLESGPAPTGANWEGRTTRRFGPGTARLSATAPGPS